MKTVPEWVTRDIPANNAATVLSMRQKVAFLVLLVCLTALVILNAGKVLFILNLVAIVLYLIFANYKLILEFIPTRAGAGAPGTERKPLRHWPYYTIMVPLYREAKAVPGLVKHLSDMDYPADRLQVLLLVEEDDDATRNAIGELPPNFEVVVVPVAQPRTKPKACNYGLRHATGEYLVVYDAEDRPEPDQLKKAATMFADSPPDVICLQARLSYYNRDQNSLTRLFTAEYATWFDLCLPGMVAADAPIPLGGTSNHFDLVALNEIGQWDPFNVTEDCDLGIRIHVHGYRTMCLDSTTWEEAVWRLGPWIRQRSRWIKGYMQTYLVHLRHQFRLLQGGRLSRLLHFHLLFGATVFCLLVNPIYWVLTVGWFLGLCDWLSGIYPVWILVPALFCLLVGNAALVLSSMLACLNRGYTHLIPWCLLMPFYWVIMSVGAWKGMLQLITNPHFWEKTPHEEGGAVVRLTPSQKQTRLGDFDGVPSPASVPAPEPAPPQEQIVQSAPPGRRPAGGNTFWLAGMSFVIFSILLWFLHRMAPESDIQYLLRSGILLDFINEESIGRQGLVSSLVVMPLPTLLALPFVPFLREEAYGLAYLYGLALACAWAVPALAVLLARLRVRAAGALSVILLGCLIAILGNTSAGDILVAISLVIVALALETSRRPMARSLAGFFYGMAVFAHFLGFAVAVTRLLANLVARFAARPAKETRGIMLIQNSGIVYGIAVFVFLTQIIMSNPVYPFIYSRAHLLGANTADISTVLMDVSRSYPKHALVVSGLWGYLAKPEIQSRSGYHFINVHRGVFQRWEKRPPLLAVPKPENPFFHLADRDLPRIAKDMGWLLLSETRYWRFYAADIKRAPRAALQ